MKKVIIDCDVGVDDALALILAFHSWELEVLAVTGVNGNVPIDQVFENIQKVLCLIRPQRKPIITKGADRPLKGKLVYAHSVHGKDGLGGAKIDRVGNEKVADIFPGTADELILKMAYAYPNELTLVAIGPLTNLGLALQKDWEGMKKLKEVVIMGGAVRTRGNITPHAEFNIFVDPLAAKMVFNSGIPISLVPLDATHQVFLTSQIIEERLKPINNAFSRFVIEAIGYDLRTHRFHRGSESIYLHDPLAMGIVIDPHLVKKESLSIDVEIQEGEYFGHTFETQECPKIDVCLAVDAEAFLNLFLARLA